MYSLDDPRNLEDYHIKGICVDVDEDGVERSESVKRELRRLGSWLPVRSPKDGRAASLPLEARSMADNSAVTGRRRGVAFLDGDLSRNHRVKDLPVALDAGSRYDLDRAASTPGLPQPPEGGSADPLTPLERNQLDLEVVSEKMQRLASRLSDSGVDHLQGKLASRSLFHQEKQQLAVDVMQLRADVDAGLGESKAGHAEPAKARFLGGLTAEAQSAVISEAAGRGKAAAGVGKTPQTMQTSSESYASSSLSSSFKQSIWELFHSLRELETFGDALTVASIRMICSAHPRLAATMSLLSAIVPAATGGETVDVMAFRTALVLARTHYGLRQPVLPRLQVLTPPSAFQHSSTTATRQSDPKLAAVTSALLRNLHRGDDDDGDDGEEGDDAPYGFSHIGELADTARHSRSTIPRNARGLPVIRRAVGPSFADDTSRRMDTTPVLHTTPANPSDPSTYAQVLTSLFHNAIEGTAPGRGPVDALVSYGTNAAGRLRGFLQIGEVGGNMRSVSYNPDSAPNREYLITAYVAQSPILNPFGDPSFQLEHLTRFDWTTFPCVTQLKKELPTFNFSSLTVFMPRSNPLPHTTLATLHSCLDSMIQVVHVMFGMGPFVRDLIRVKNTELITMRFEEFVRENAAVKVIDKPEQVAVNSVLSWFNAAFAEWRREARAVVLAVTESSQSVIVTLTDRGQISSEYHLPPATLPSFYDQLKKQVRIQLAIPGLSVSASSSSTGAARAGKGPRNSSVSAPASGGRERLPDLKPELLSKYPSSVSEGSPVPEACYQSRKFWIHGGVSHLLRMVPGIGEIKFGASDKRLCPLRLHFTKCTSSSCTDIHLTRSGRVCGPLEAE